MGEFRMQCLRIGGGYVDLCGLRVGKVVSPNRFDY